VRESVLLAGIHGEVVLAGIGGVDKFDFDIFADAFEVAITPQFPRVGVGGAAALSRSAFVGSAGGVGFNLVGRTSDNVNVPAIGLPAGNAGGEMLIGVGETAVVLFLEGVFRGFGMRVASVPEDFDGLFALFVGG
jgi:hypothetical protein